MKAVILIPARLDSSRLDRKMLADLEGEPLIVRTWRQALKSRLAEKVVVATDSREIAAVLDACGAEVVMTSPTASCGTERIAEAARHIEGDVFVNLQGDEPLISPENIDLALEPFFSENPPDCSTLVLPLRPDDHVQIEDPHQVKVVMDAKGFALYFSRSAIPFQRNMRPTTIVYRHIGLYAFSADVLQKFASLPPSMLEEAESLEQLRLLENGFRIQCVTTLVDNPGVNTVEDLEQVRRIIRSSLPG
ncbi:3-deoxy-manno-octulosonate cytidylyltransferase [Pelodictyon phaeoclathratiforme]|jgi:3-deoxy-manno-octulosonate cytidylyltransferase (CMP-KDO synthetase)|uniref:3-deoxy-manno-octulosonate cytidylyltransferase n=1 Tax=Pelodictyon phaeoclathratiforme (strain DSM 5477 / BU-1) TaxID=324925 RepID=KDSB_PELPB|nr:3-deoxy-manno-octulosonate cytidylyltransferase [Pelodictyon phaeoclathratiforme]B4SES6.1 RecName: Full=3-deoxy-manno-octulosonate cytidylyltransferase; AltName: Full=CMP-2-keto-3-deoxyoctulosonic acid synthase; Short=CKS; Short=CMP-KDO synthase [Pelodictyon phaeoclathratiforme BU-1]ACF44602.1 3-deoxy-D-manno-octulosonate cytidylyltransferase [Pelodictyon phaeoclathratiforme BU-1]MBV5288976.1 3-deoxy-manno-octulosonate cytidylyltransferase [Pelodictyon phaeoclathratiforme]